MKKIITALLTASLIVTCAASVGFAAQKTSAKTSTKTVAKKTVAKKTAAKTAAKPAQKTKQLPQTQCKILPGHTETADTLLVTAEWLKNNLNNVILIDCRFASLYQASHIPGAVSAPWTYFVNTTAPNGSEEYGTILPAEQLAKKIGALGINGNRQVVCYSDTGDWGQGAWTVAVLRIAGITNAKMLDGGIYVWKNAKYPLTNKPSKNKAVPFAIQQSVKDEYVILTDGVQELMGKPTTVIADVRTLPEYEGKIAPFKEKRKGHLPGAIHLPMDNFVDIASGRFKTADEIKAELEAKGITKDTDLVLYDTCGVRAGFAAMACRMAGFGKAKFYDNGFQAWAGNDMMPIEVTEQQ